MDIIHYIIRKKFSEDQAFAVHKVHFELQPAEEDRDACLSGDQHTFDFRLNDFPTLKRLEVWPTEQQLWSVKRIQEERDHLNRTSLEMIVSGFRELLVSCERDLGDLCLTPGFLEQIEKNRSKFVGCFPWEACLDLTILANHSNTISNDSFNLFEHFTNVRAITSDYSVTSLRLNGLSQARLIELILSEATFGFCNLVA